MKTSTILTALLISWILQPILVGFYYWTPIDIDNSTNEQVEVWKVSIPYYLFGIGYRRLGQYHPVNWTGEGGIWNMTHEWSSESEP